MQGPFLIVLRVFCVIAPIDDLGSLKKHLGARLRHFNSEKTLQMEAKF